MRKKEELNCPNCGAVITGIKCEYCGTQFFNLADIDLQKAGYLRINTGDEVHTFKAIPTDMQIEWSYPGSIFYMDNNPVRLPNIGDGGTVTLEFKVLPERGGTFWRIYNTKENKKDGN